MPTKTAAAVWSATETLRDACDALTFAEPVHAVYNPLVYAGAMHKKYVERFATSKRRVLFLGMNPGPFGMAQTGIPFGEIDAVKTWMKIKAPITKPPREHPKRPVLGLDCPRSEVSGRRLWGVFAEAFGDAKSFFKNHYVANYCPLVFLEQSGRNRTPDKLPKAERDALDAVCDAHLSTLIDLLAPETAVGVGKYAEACIKRVAGDRPKLTIGSVLHPSPASPMANRGFAPQAMKQLEALGVL